MRTPARSLVLAGAAMVLVAACEPRPTQSTPAGDDLHHGPSLSATDLQELRRVTSRFHDLDQALGQGYAIFGGCFSDPNQGGMGQHYANDALIQDPAIRLERPELLLYETDADGNQHLVAVEYIVFVDDWHNAGNTNPPRLFNTDFKINSVLLPEPFYLLHAWAWKRNPSGLVADWNPRVICN